MNFLRILFIFLALFLAFVLGIAFYYVALLISIVVVIGLFSVALNKMSRAK